MYKYLYLDRLMKHGKLAPTKEIGRKFDETEIKKILAAKKKEKMNLNNKKITSEELKREEEDRSVSSNGENEINYYDLNDSWIDDSDVASDYSQNDFFNLTLTYGNYSEEDVIKNLMKTTKQKNQKKKKRLERKENENNFKNKKNSVSNFPTTVSHQNLTVNDQMIIDSEVNNLSNIPNIFDSPKKRKFTEMEKKEKEKPEGNLTSKDEEVSKLKDKIELLNMDSNLSEIFLEAFKDSPNIPHKEKINLIKKVSLHFRKIKGDEKKTLDFLQNISAMIDINIDELNFLLNFENQKVKREGIFSNLAKLINKLITFLTDNNIRTITEKILENSEVDEKFSALANKIITYLEIIVEINKYVKDEYSQNVISIYYEKNRTGLISTEDAKDKIFRKFKETLEKNTMGIELKIISSILNKYILNQEKRENAINPENKINFQDFFFSEHEDINVINENFEESGDISNLNSTNILKPNTENEKKKSEKSKKKEIKKKASKNISNNEKEQLNEEDILKSPSFKKRKSSGIKLIDIPKIFTSEPNHNNRFYVKQYEEKDFN